ncbi:MAG: TatD family hydrolase [Thermoleophilia bacterium]|nr:TatD family hydrolase [Thermoleophilia bacterium]
MIDSHTHLDHCHEDPAWLVADAAEAGVGLIIQSGIDLQRSRYSVELAERFPQVYATVGFHPHEAGHLDETGLAEIRELTANPRVVAVGETGFDYYHDHWPHGVQGEVFAQHMELARCAGLPVVVHTREAAADTLKSLDRHGTGLTVVLHCFSLPERLDELAERGYYISFAGNVTYKNAVHLQAAARRAPDHLLLLETDAPWLAPVPTRGRPNRPALVAKTYEFVAGLRAVTVEELAVQVEANVRAAFPRILRVEPRAGG